MHEKISFDEHLHRIFGDDYDAFISHAPVGEFVRVNTQRATPERVMSLLKSQGFDVEQVAGLDDAIRLRTKPFEPTRCLHHFAGWFVKQSLSSQLPVRFLDARPGQTIIDLCAAPGSKTTQIATAMHHEGCLFANDLAGKRMTPLAARLDAGIVSHAVLFNVAAERLPHYLDPVFDRVLADVPCSGSSMRSTKTGIATKLPKIHRRNTSFNIAYCSRGRAYCASVGAWSIRLARSIPTKTKASSLNSSRVIRSD